MKRITSIAIAMMAVLVLVRVGAATQAASPPAAQADIDRIFARWSASTPGCAVGTSLRGQTRVAAYGMANLEHDVANTPETIFEAGSVSKQFRGGGPAARERWQNLARRSGPQVHPGTAGLRYADHGPSDADAHERAA
jgi:hypothetical protein